MWKRRLEQVFIGISFEFLRARTATKVVGLASVFELMFCSRRIHVHAANRIFHSGCGR
jgi:hypothetical protein